MIVGTPELLTIMAHIHALGNTYYDCLNVCRLSLFLRYYGVLKLVPCCLGVIARINRRGHADTSVEQLRDSCKRNAVLC